MKTVLLFIFITFATLHTYAGGSGGGGGVRPEPFSIDSKVKKN